MILRFSFSLSGFHPSLAILADEEEASQGISRGYFSFWKWIRGRIDIEHSIRRRVDSVVKSGRCIRVIFFLVQPSCWCVFFSVFWVFQSFFFWVVGPVLLVVARRRTADWWQQSGQPGNPRRVSPSLLVLFLVFVFVFFVSSSSSSSFLISTRVSSRKTPPPEKKAKYKEKEKNKKTEQEEEE